MKYIKPQADIVYFEDNEFMAGSGNTSGGYCNNYKGCGHVTPCNGYGGLCALNFLCGNFVFECDGVAPLGIDMGFECLGYW